MKDKRRMLDELKDNLGNITLAARACGISRRLHFIWMKEDEAYAAEFRDILEQQGDFVENKLLENIRSNDTTSIIFYCKTKLKERGYVEKKEVEAKVQGTISHEEFVNELLGDDK